MYKKTGSSVINLTMILNPQILKVNTKNTDTIMPRTTYTKKNIPPLNNLILISIQMQPIHNYPKLPSKDN